MDNAQYQQQVLAAKAYAEAGEFREAEKGYRKALGGAPPGDMQSLIEVIMEMKAKAAAQPKKDATVSARSDKGFTLYDTSFKDVLGYNAQKRVIMRNLEIVKGKEQDYAQLDISQSTGFLFYGPPGTGKTWMAKAISGELKIPMKDVVISEILGKYVGESEKAIKKVFDEAKACHPSLLFFDEVDALASSRENANDFSSADLKNLVNEFLKQMSELHDNKHITVFVVAATNLPWLVDPAMKRSGRLEHQVFFGPPGFWERRKMFKYYMDTGESKYTFKANLSLLSIATIRYSPADIEKVCTVVKKAAIKSGKYLITTSDVQRVLKDKNEGISSLDEWVLKAKDTYIKKSKTLVHHTGFMGMKKEKERVEESGKMSAGELKTYKPLINYIKRTMRWWTFSNVVRRMAKGI